MGRIVAWIFSRLRDYLAQLEAEVEAYEKEKAEKEAQIAALQKATDDLEQQIQAATARQQDLDTQLQAQLKAIDETESQLKDALAPKPRPVLSDDAELERLSARTD